MSNRHGIISKEKVKLTNLCTPAGKRFTFLTRKQGNLGMSYSVGIQDFPKVGRQASGIATFGRNQIGGANLQG